MENLQGESAWGVLLVILFMAAALAAGWFVFGVSATA